MTSVLSLNQAPVVPIRGHSVSAFARPTPVVVMWSHHYLALYSVALGLTIAIEAPVYATLLRSTATVRLPSGLMTGSGLNLASHPVAFLLVFPLLSPMVGTVMALIIAEVVAWGVETIILCAVLRRNTVVLSGISYVANAISLSVGLLLFR